MIRPDNASPFFEYKEYRPDHHGKSNNVIPPQIFFKVNCGENAEYNQGNNLLNGLQLGGGELVMSHAVCRHLKAIFNKGNKPAYKDNLGKGRFLILEMPVPCNCHEYI